MNSFKEIYATYAQKVYRFLVRLTGNIDLAEELTSETFYQAFLHIGKFRGECSIDTWLCQIAKNCYYKELKRNKKLNLEQIEYVLEQKQKEKETAFFIETGFQTVEDRQMALTLHKILHSLEEPYREVFSLRVFGELQFKEIATIFNKSESWAKMTYYRAKAKLVEKMEEQNGK